MRLAVTAALPNAIVFVMDYEFGESPEDLGGGIIAATPTCVIVGTLHEQFGNTELVLTDQIHEIDQTNMNVIFDGHIECSSGELSLVSALDEKLISMPLKSTHVRMRVFVNDDIEPDRVAILVGQRNDRAKAAHIVSLDELMNRAACGGRQVLLAYGRDHLRRLTSIAVGGQQRVSFAYDPGNLMVSRTRVNQTVNGATHFIHDLFGNVIAEAAPTGLTQREYIHLPEGLETPATPTAGRVLLSAHPLIPRTGIHFLERMRGPARPVAPARRV